MWSVPGIHVTLVSKAFEPSPLDVTPEAMHDVSTTLPHAVAAGATGGELEASGNCDKEETTCGKTVVEGLPSRPLAAAAGATCGTDDTLATTLGETSWVYVIWQLRHR